ncbi:MAG: B12-binding domain-containing protein [Candidatus Freyarchaeota archaeon]
MSENLVDLIVGLNEKEAVELVRKRVESGEDPLKILDEVRTAMAQVGDKFEKKEFFLPDLIMSGEKKPSASARSYSEQSTGTSTTSARTSSTSCLMRTASRLSTSAWTCRRRNS